MILIKIFSISCVEVPTEPFSVIPGSKSLFDCATLCPAASNFKTRLRTSGLLSITDAGIASEADGKTFGKFGSLTNIPDGYLPMRVSICLLRDLRRFFLFSIETIAVDTDVSDNL